jgi:hypothetical protein
MPERYSVLAKFWAPYFIHASKAPVDWPTRYDGDGDWDLTNNVQNFDREAYSHQAYVYYDVFESQNAYALVYTVYNVKDQKKPIRPLEQLRLLHGIFRRIPWEVSGSHEHDSEGVIVYIEKDGTRFGKFKLLLTKAHNWLIPYAAGTKYLDRLIEYDRKRSIAHWWDVFFRVNSVASYMKHVNPYAANHHRRDAPLQFIDDSFGRHPMILIGPAEEGHGQYKFNPKFWDFARVLPLAQGRSFVEPTAGMVYRYTGSADDPSKLGTGAPIGYDLIPTTETLVTPEMRLRTEQNWLEDMASRFLLTNHEDDFVSIKRGPGPFYHLPRYLAAGDRDERGSNPFWGWLDFHSEIGIDPIGFLYNRLPQLAQQLSLSTVYLFNPYAKDRCYHTGLGCGPVLKANPSTASR